MPVETKTFEIESGPDTDIINITDQVVQALKESKIKSGTVTIFIPGSTASVTTTEFEPNLNSDLKEAVERIVPSNIEYKHHKTWDDENGKSHVRSSLFKPSLTIPFKDKSLMLGQWQQLVILDFDVPPRKREVILQLIGE